MMQLLLRLLDQAYDRKSWHGTNLRGSIRGMSAATAAYRPERRRHSIQEIVVHAAYWKYAVRRRLTGEKRGGFPLKGSNWFPREHGGGEQLWKEDVALLDRCHRELRDAVAAFPESKLHEVPAGSKLPHLDVLLGIAAHDLYHAGQIQTLKKSAGG